MGATSPGTGGGAQAAQILLPAGQLRELRVHVVVENDPPTSGKLKVSVFVNGVESKLKCSVSGTGICKTNKKRKVNIANDDGVGFRVQNNLVGAGATVVTMTVLYD